ncbi:terminase large subunit domain-containing protein [Gordonia sputi]|uniref:terminase large subunit domain-containing protein n=1 Tax=Gordonia sputi TaxID=36823 RepID=UPI0036C48330
MTTAAEVSALRSAVSRIDVFAEKLVGAPLWPHQLEMATSTARIRVMCAGRQVGKSRTLAVEALHKAFTQAGALVLLISAGEVASRRLLEECTALAVGSPLLSGSVVDEQKAQLTLSNGSRIVSVPASDKQIRGWPVDLLIIDEAGFVAEEIWRAAEPAIIARPGARIILSSSPWGGLEHFFRRLWQRGLTSPDARYASFHWPSSMNPLVSADDLEAIREREPSHYFNREYLAEWTDESGAYFTTSEIDTAVADYELIEPRRVMSGSMVVGGIDWGHAHDANCVVYLAALGDVELNRAQHGDEPIFWIPWLEHHFRMEYADFIAQLVQHANRFDVVRFMSETNGVGQMPTQELRRLLQQDSTTMVSGVVTDTRRKSGGFGRIKMLLQRGRLILPRHPELLKQLHSLTFEQTEMGHFKISVPESAGHDDLAMALMQAVSAINTLRNESYGEQRDGQGAIITTDRGTKLPVRPGFIAHDPVLFRGGKLV